MKGSGLFTILSALILLFVACSSAWPWPDSLDSIDALIVARQADEEPATTTPAPDANSDDNANTDDANTDDANTDDNANTDDDANTDDAGTITASPSISASASRSSNSTSTRTTPIDPRLPPGGISLITPAAIDGMQYYKVGDFVTFKWNYTSLSVTPSAIDVLASCAVNQATYTISGNMTVEETGEIIWDTGEMYATATDKFPVATYTLIVHDSSKDVTDIPSAGFLGAYAQYQFGMYLRQSYTPLNEFKCATCNAAFSVHEKQALGVVMTTAAITVVSFTWFARGFGLF